MNACRHKTQTPGDGPITSSQHNLQSHLLELINPNPILMPNSVGRVSTSARPTSSITRAYLRPTNTMSPAVDEEEDRPVPDQSAAAADVLAPPPPYIAAAKPFHHPNGHACNSSATPPEPLQPFPDDRVVKPVLPPLPLTVSTAPVDPVIAASQPSRGRKRRKTESSSSSPPPRPHHPSVATPSVTYEDSRRMFQKLWTDADEMTILEGFLEFTSARGTTHADYQHDTGPFYDQIKGRLSLDFTKSQIAEKLRRLKKKYRNMAARMASDKAFVFRSHHDEATFQIASKIWNPTFKRSKPRNPLSMHNEEDDDQDEDEEYEGYAGHYDNIAVATPAAAAASARGGGGGGGLSLEDTANSSIPPAETVEVAAATAAATAAMLPGSKNAASAVTPPVSAAASVGVDGNAHLPVPKKEAEEAPWSSRPSNSANLGTLPGLNDLLLRPLYLNPLGLGLGNGGGGGMRQHPLPHSHPADDKWKEQHILELEVYLKRMDLLHEHIQSKLEELRSQSLATSTTN